MATETSEWMSVNLARVHDGQIVTPVVEHHRDRREYVVRFAMHDASVERPEDRLGPWTEHRGDYWECVRWLQGNGIHIDDTTGF